MLKRFARFICIVLCVAMIGTFTSTAEGIPGEHMPHGPNDPTHHVDITDGAWYAEPCRFAYAANFMVGTSETHFSPHSLMTREMAVVTIIKYFYLGIDWGQYQDTIPEASEINSIIVPEYSEIYFDDVEPGRWYSNFIQLAYENGMIAGIGDKKFGLREPITREDFLVMMYSMVTPVADGIRILFNNNSKDIEQASEYARDAFTCFKNTHNTIVWGSYNSYAPALIAGFPDGSYHLQDNITRAEAAAILYDFLYYPKKFAGYESVNT